VEASGGVFTSHHTHEFQVVTESGEDTIFYCDSCNWAENREIFKGKNGDLCPACREGKVVEAKAIEVGNIFPLGTWFAERWVFFIPIKMVKRSRCGLEVTVSVQREQWERG